MDIKPFPLAPPPAPDTSGIEEWREANQPPPPPTRKCCKTPRGSETHEDDCPQLLGLKRREEKRRGVTTTLSRRDSEAQTTPNKSNSTKQGPTKGKCSCSNHLGGSKWLYPNRQSAMWVSNHRWGGMAEPYKCHDPNFKGWHLSTSGRIRGRMKPKSKARKPRRRRKR